MNDIERFEHLQTTIKLNPKNFQARRELIMLCLDLGFEKVALFHIKYLLDIFPDDANLYFNTGICWEKLKNLDNALIAYKKAVEIAPDEPDFLYNLALVYEQLGDIDSAMENFKKVIFYKNEDSNAFFSIGLLYSQKNDSKTAIKCFKKAIEYNYSDYFAHFYLAQEYKKNKEYDFALNEYRKVLELSSDYSWAYYNSAQIYYEINRIDDSITMLKKAYEKNPKDLECLKILCLILISEARQDEAMDILNDFAQREENGDVYYLMSKIFELNEDEFAQLDCLESALENISSLTFNSNAVKKEFRELNKELKNK